MKQFSFSLAVLAVLSLATSATAQNTFELCPVDIDAACLEAIADHVITDQPTITDRQVLALRYANTLMSKAPNHARRLIETFSHGADWQTLRSIAGQYSENGQTADAAMLILAATESTAKDTNPSDKIYNMLILAEDAAKIGEFDLTRRIHNTIIPHLPGRLDTNIPLKEELRLARLMTLYGWPQDAHPVLDAAYTMSKQIPQDSLDYGYTLTRLVNVSILSGHHALRQQLEADIAVFLTRAEPHIQTNVIKEHITALVKAGKIEDAKETADEYGLVFDQAVQYEAHFFLEAESGYFPGIPDSSLRRFEAMFVEIKRPNLQTQFLDALARQMVDERMFDDLEAVLDRTTDPKLRSYIVRELMIYHAQKQGDAKTAADLYFSERPQIVRDFLVFGTFREQHALNLTASGLLEAGDLERGGQLADEVFKLWTEDQSDRRSLPTSLFQALAIAGDEDRIGIWYAALDDPNDKMEVLIWSLYTQVDAGQFDKVGPVREQLKGLVPLFSDVQRNNVTSFLAAGLHNPTQREVALKKLYHLDIAIVLALFRFNHSAQARDLLEEIEVEKATLISIFAAFGDLDQARTLFEEMKMDETYPLVAHMEILDATIRAGDTDQANIEKHAILDNLLLGTIEAQHMIYIADLMHP